MAARVLVGVLVTVLGGCGSSGGGACGGDTFSGTATLTSGSGVCTQSLDFSSAQLGDAGASCTVTPGGDGVSCSWMIDCQDSMIALYGSAGALTGSATITVPQIDPGFPPTTCSYSVQGIYGP